MADVIDIVLRARDEVSTAAKSAQGSLGSLGTFIKQNERDFRAVGTAGAAVAASLALVRRAGVELSPEMESAAHTIELVSAAVGVLGLAIPAVTAGIRVLSLAVTALGATGLGLLVTAAAAATAALLSLGTAAREQVAPSLEFANARVQQLTANIDAMRGGLEPAGAALDRLNESFKAFTASAGSVADLFRAKFGGEIPAAVADALERVNAIVVSSTGVLNQNFERAIRELRNDAVALLGEDVPDAFFDAMETIKSTWAAGATEVVATTDALATGVVGSVGTMRATIASSWPAVEAGLAVPVELGVQRGLFALSSLNAAVQQSAAVAGQVGSAASAGFQGPTGGISFGGTTPTNITEARAELARLGKLSNSFDASTPSFLTQALEDKIRSLQRAIVGGDFGAASTSSTASPFSGGFGGFSGGGGGNFVNNGEVKIIFQSDASLVELAELLAEAT